MIDLTIDSRYTLDLKDDFMMNEELNLYEFIGNDPVKAFYLGLHIREWFDDLDKEQKYLYSKQIRHVKDDLDKYQKQFEFWSNKYSQEDVDLVEFAEYVLNNMFWEEETEELDTIKMAFWFGSLIYQHKEDE